MNLLRFIFAVLLVTFAATLPAATTNELLAITAPWRYQTNNLDGVNWQATNYDDSTWPGPGNALLYIETSTAIPAPKNTPLPPRVSDSLPCITYYFRTVFTATNVPEILALQFNCLVDDGAVFYLNGTEIKRVNMPGGAIVYTNFASAVDEATIFDRFVIQGSQLTNLLAGTNTLAAEVHQANATSSDIVFGTAITTVSGTNITRGPYLQTSTPSSIVIRWRTTMNADSRVAFGTNITALDQFFTDSSQTNEHIVTLTNLTADTKYFYAVGTSQENLAPATTNQFFLTHPLPGTTKPLRVWVIGDAGTHNSNQAAVRDAFYNFNGTNTVHAWLQLGDNAYDSGTDDEYQAAVFDMYADLLRRSVTWPTLGNHDTAQATAYVDTYPYFSIFTLPTAGQAGGVSSGTQHYYSFDLGMVHFICLDSMTASRSTNDAMLTWLQSDLAVTTNRWIIAYWHHPPYTKGSHDSDAEDQLTSVRTNFLPILEAGGVDLVLCGHSHCYERSFFINGHYGVSPTFTNDFIVQPGNGRGQDAYHKPDGLGETPFGNRGTIYTVAGSSGQATTGTMNHPAMFYSALSLGSVVLDFSENRLDALFLRENGTTNDSYTIIKEGTYPPRTSGLRWLDNGDLRATVLTRAYRDNILETSTNFVAWSPLTTNFSTNASIEMEIPAIDGNPRFFRIRRR